MKWKIRLRFWAVGFGLTVVTGAMIYVAISLYNDTLYFDSVNTVATFAMGMVSLLIAVAAFILSVITYISIDSVNMLSSMEGNVLCNENYNAEYISLVEEYNDCNTQDMLQDKLFDDIEAYYATHNKTCMLFTDFLQFFIDRLLWFAYLDSNGEVYQTRVHDILKKIETRYKEFIAISNGNQYVLREHLKLIRNVLNYQAQHNEAGRINFGGELLNVRGRMLANSVSKTIYYDYLGLEYHRHALRDLRKMVGFEGEEFIKENMDKICNYTYSEHEKKTLNMYLNQAQEAFKNAVLSSENDMIWRGYISFNKARIDLLSYLINNNFPEDNSWKDSIHTAVESRFLVRCVFAPDNQKSSFLQREFIKEYIYAAALELNICFYKSTDDKEKANHKNAAKSLLEEIKEITKTEDKVFARAQKYLNDILTCDIAQNVVKY